jgi:hypothetical protein
MRLIGRDKDLTFGDRLGIIAKPIRQLARALGLGKVMASWQSDLAAATEAAYIQR